MDREQEKWFEEQGGGYFISILEGTIWMRVHNLTDEPIVNVVKRVEAARHGAKWKAPIRGDMIYVSAYNLLFYAIRFPDGRQWDVVNGFRE